MPFVDTLRSAIDKVQAAPPAARGVVGQAWLQQVPLRIAYDGARGRTTERTVRIEEVIVGRGMMLRCAVRCGSALT